MPVCSNIVTLTLNVVTVVGERTENGNRLKFECLSLDLYTSVAKAIRSQFVNIWISQLRQVGCSSLYWNEFEE